MSRRIGNTWNTDLEHFLQDGRIPDGLPGPARNLLIHLGAIVGWMTSREVEGIERTNVPCRRSPDRQRCAQEIEAWFAFHGLVIAWRCPRCGDEGNIQKWQGSPWDRGQAKMPEPEDILATYQKMAEPITRGQERPRIVIEKDEPVALCLDEEERDLLDNLLVLDPEYVGRLQKTERGYEGRFTLDDLEDILGYVASEANHCEDRELEDRLGRLHDRLLELQNRYDDGSWGT